MGQRMIHLFLPTLAIVAHNLLGKSTTRLQGRECKKNNRQVEIGTSISVWQVATWQVKQWTSFASFYHVRACSFRIRALCWWRHRAHVDTPCFLHGCQYHTTDHCLSDASTRASSLGSRPNIDSRCFVQLSYTVTRSYHHLAHCSHDGRSSAIMHLSTSMHVCGMHG